jgi:hypothetical protein
MIKKKPHLFDNLLIGSFILGLFVPMILTHNRNESVIEQRKLAPFPELGWNQKAIASFPSKFEAFFNDHFGLRDQLVQVYSLYSIILKTSSNPHVLLGLDDWLFYINPKEGNSLEDYRRNDPLTNEEIKHWKNSLESKYLSLKAQGIPYLFVIVPDKYTIYPEYIPSHIRQIGKQTRREQLVTYMQGSEVPILDLTPALLAAKNKGQLFYKTDTHWNDFGAAIAHAELIRTIQLHFQKLSKDKSREVPTLSVPIDYGVDDFRLVEYRSGDIANMLNIAYLLKEMVPELIKPLPSCEKQFLESSSADPKKATFSTNCRTDAPTALIFRDSFFIGLQPYISQYLGKTVYIWEWPDQSLIQKNLEYNQADIVIEERVERHLKFIP